LRKNLTARAAAAAMGVLIMGGGALADPATTDQTLSIDSFYSGVWHEQARTPTSLTRGCEYATTVYGRDGEGRITVRDACLQGGPNGRERALGGIGAILDPGRNAVLHVRYRFGIFRPSREYRIIAVGPGREWFISAEPGFARIYIFTRAARPPHAQVDALIARARALGYLGPLEILASRPS
jgi:apolipoprotein D and lipocalin family protein